MAREKGDSLPHDSPLLAVRTFKREISCRFESAAQLQGKKGVHPLIRDLW
jgi:hypothetical protein